ncbi:putative ankyrin repeat-containing protein [Talaromyces proteolyticus]|uniref:Ankyrin repeat-containing protein n=1 Tax=Talaromyces proteolyticus TaxID=1131652 RepID=A0AAD4PTX9_9EURO|nr:putative ankyrin repeat-containing protein [Talaromyces proteolyticus]KAH8694013.1 putative ankyrin repeat-containing protein [Talaromyces proteolyticus]
MLAHYIPLFFCLAVCVSADGWDDFTNNLATDLAPLITLFGERITIQCLSESTSILDDIIFALAPLGVLTAVVSAIRVCGNSTLRAFIGRAQEDPGSVERELLSCVSDSTAEIFSDSGVSRITGNPKILEVVIDENPKNDGMLDIKKVREIAKSNSPSDLEDDIRPPNLSLNKGIRRRTQFWFYLAAIFGVGLQAGVIIFAILTVSRWAQAFQKNGHAVDSYALPMFIIGTALLALGMFFCALVVERFSAKHYFPMPSGSSRVYWVQPGNQMVGDQVFPAFVGRTDKGAIYTRSVRHRSPDKLWYLSKEVWLIHIVALTMIGFVMQFIGQRGLHSSVTLAQLGSTMVMTAVRTSLRAQRMHEDDNMLGRDQKMVSNGGHELDWLAFSLMKIQSFEICPITTSTAQNSEETPHCIVQNLIKTRQRLRELAGLHWNETSIVKAAEKLAQAIYKCILLEPGSQFTLNIPIEVQEEKTSETMREVFEIPISIDKNYKSYINIFEPILGLYVWSIKRANPELDETCQYSFFKAFRINNKNAHQKRLLLRKWINAVSFTDQAQQPAKFLKRCQTFGNTKSSTGIQGNDDDVLITVTSSLYALAAQDIFTHIFSSMSKHFKNTSAGTYISGFDESSFIARNGNLESAKEAFINAGLGDSVEAALCILPALYDRQLIPEISLNTCELREQIKEFVKAREYDKALTMSEWLCCLCDYEQVERSLVEYGFLNLQCLMDPYFGIRGTSFEYIAAIVNPTAENRSAQLSYDLLDKLASKPQKEWWEKFRKEMHWMAIGICQYQAKHNLQESTGQLLRSVQTRLGPGSPFNEIDPDSEFTALLHGALLDLWFGTVGWAVLDDEYVYQKVLDWLVENDHSLILEWLIIQLTGNVFPRFNEEKITEMASFAASKQYNNVIQMLARHIERDQSLQGEIVSNLALQGDAKTLEMIFGCWEEAVLTTAREIALLRAAGNKQLSVIEANIQHGVNLHACDSTQETALMKAAANGDAASVTLILKHIYPVNIDTCNVEGDTALIMAAALGHARVVEILVDNGADVNRTGKGGRTALMAAISVKSLPVVRYLLSRNADVHVQDYSQATVLDAAIYVGFDGPWKEGCELLEQAGATRGLHQRK